MKFHDELCNVKITIIHKLVTEGKKTRHILRSCKSHYASGAVSYSLWDKPTCYSALKLAWC